MSRREIIVPMLERHLQKAVLEWLELKNVFHYRSGCQGQIKSWKVVNGITVPRWGTNPMRGISDITGVLPGGRAFYLELKSSKGKLSEHQKAFLENAEKAGALTIEARSLEEVESAILPHL